MDRWKNRVFLSLTNFKGNFSLIGCSWVLPAQSASLSAWAQAGVIHSQWEAERACTIFLRNQSKSCVSDRQWHPPPHSQWWLCSQSAENISHCCHRSVWISFPQGLSPWNSLPSVTALPVRWHPNFAFICYFWKEGRKPSGRARLIVAKPQI